MNLGNRFFVRGFFALCTVVVVYLCFWGVPGVFWTLNAKAVDQVFIFRSGRASLTPSYDDRIVHVDLNDSSIQKLDNFYPNRTHFAQVVRNLSQMGAAAQLFDFIFAARTSDQDDAALIDAVSDAGNVYFGMAFALQTGGPGSLLSEQRRYLDKTLWRISWKGSPGPLYAGRRPFPTYLDLAQASRGLGSISVKPDLDGVFRRIPLLVRYRDGVYPSISLRAVCDYLQVPPEKIEVRPGKYILLKDADDPAGASVKDIAIPIDRRGNMIINFLGPWGSMKHYSFADVFRASETPSVMAQWTDELEEKIAVVTNVSTGSADIGPVPTDQTFPLSGLHSSAIHTMLTGAFLKEVPPLAMLGIELFLMLVVVTLSLRFSPILFSVTTTATAGAYLGAAAAAFLFAGVILNIARPLLMVFLVFAAIQILTALENARRHAAAEKAREMAEYDLEIGRKIQAGFFPDTLPAPEGWGLFAYFQSARQVAGDFYDIFQPGENRPVAIVVADVCDKGVGAALFMALIRSLLRSSTIQYYGEKAYHPDSVSNQAEEALRLVVTRVNTYLDETHAEANMFATLFFGLLDPKTGMLYYINAGHEKPVIIGPEGIKEELGTCGPAVGAFPGVAYQTASVQLAPGDFCFAFTDGVVDAKNPSGDFYTKENLISLLTEPCDSAEAMRDRIRRSLLAHIADADQFDDITMVLFHRNASAGSPPETESGSR